MKRFGYTLAILASSVLASACTDEETTVNAPPAGGTSGDESSTFDHDNSGISPWELLDRLQQEGPPSFTSRVHSCSKVRYATLGNILRSLNIPIPTAAPATGDVSAGALYFTGDNAMGVANYANRIRESVSISTSGASREFDIFASAADTIIANFANNSIARCPGATLFDANDSCQVSGITCLIGAPATTRHLDYCNLTVATASDKTVGKRLAVAAMMAAAYTCE
jgi:hypothetical protein